MINPLNKITPTNARKIKGQHIGPLMSKICINSKNLANQATKNQESFNLSKSIDEKIAKKKNFEDDLANELEIVLWNKSKSKKMLNFVCSKDSVLKSLAKNQNCFRSPPNYLFKKTNDPLREIGKVQIKIFESESGERSFKFFFETCDSSVVESKKFQDQEEIKWKGGKDNLNFKINLNQTPTKLSWNDKFGLGNSGKENIFGSLFQPTANNILTPSPKGDLNFLFIFRKLSFLLS